MTSTAKYRVRLVFLRLLWDGLAGLAACLLKGSILWCLSFGAFAPAAAQVYEIPFASKANRIELTVANSAQKDGSAILVTATEVPGWIVMSRREATIEGLRAGGEQTVLFSFDAKEDTPAGTEGTLRFTISENGRPLAGRAYRLKSGAPRSFELLANYPNPFNPTTTITYQLPQASRVSIRVFDVLGRQVAQLLDGNVEAGRHTLRWEASGYASGLYIYRMVARGQHGGEFIQQKKMLLIK